MKTTLLSAFALAGALVAAQGCVDDTETAEDNVTDIGNSKVKNQSIGNCWVYATVGWAESLHLSQTATELNLSESYLSYMHWYEQIAGGPGKERAGAQLEKGEITTGGWFGLAAELMRRYGVMDEGAFIPEEAEAARSSRQSSALSAINASLKTGALKDPAARKDRKLVRAELDKAWGLTPEVSKLLDDVFGADMNRSLLAEGLPIPEGSGLHYAKEILVGKNITLSDAIGTPASSFDVLTRKGKYAWTEQSYPSSPKSRRDMQIKVQRAMHAGMPVVMSWFVDFAAMKNNRFVEPPTTPGRQGGHMVVLEDYQIKGVPGFGTLEAGKVVTDKKALEAALSPDAVLEFFRIKNSWGSALAPEGATEEFRGFHDLFMTYLDATMTRCTASNGEACAIKSNVQGLKSFILPSDAFVTDAKAVEGACVDPCVAGEARKTSCGTCEAAVCAADSFCCNNAWDDVCVGAVEAQCGISCNAE